MLMAGTDERARLEERARWVGGERSEDGIPAGALGPRPSGALVVRDLAVRAADRRRAVAEFEQRPVLALLSARRNDALGWMATGQALQRVLLTAARSGLSASFLNQVLGRRETRRLVHGPHEADAHPQMLMRLGYGPLTQPTPRRSLAELTADRDPSGPGGARR